MMDAPRKAEEVPQRVGEALADEQQDHDIIGDMEAPLYEFDDDRL